VETVASLESGARSLVDDVKLQRAIADFDKAKQRSTEQRVRWVVVVTVVVVVKVVVIVVV